MNEASRYRPRVSSPAEWPGGMKKKEGAQWPLSVCADVHRRSARLPGYVHGRGARGHEACAVERAGRHRLQIDRRREPGCWRIVAVESERREVGRVDRHAVVGTRLAGDPDSV